MGRMRRAMAAVLVVVIGLAGCTSKPAAKKIHVPKSVGAGEGALSLLSWTGYTESGAEDSGVDWVGPFQRQTKCKVTVRYVTSATALIALMSRSDLSFDGAAVPPEIASQLIAGKQVAPVNTRLVPNFRDLDPKLSGQVTKKNTHYGVPFVWGSDLLMYDSKAVRPAPDSWAALFDARQAAKYAGRLADRDNPLTLGTVALYLKDHQPKLHITDPYELTPKQLTAAADVLAKQYPLVKSYWLNSQDAVDDFISQGVVLGQVWPYHADLLTRAGRPVAAVTPREGTTGWLNSWMIGARAEHLNCMYKWLNWVSSPEVQNQVSQWNGVAPANPGACTLRSRSRFCAAYHVGDAAYVDRITFAKTPTADCGGAGKGCTTFLQWIKAWDHARRWSPSR